MPVPAPAAEMVLWAGTVRTSSFVERVAAAAAAGYTALSLSALDYRQARATGLSDRGMRARMADAGLELACLDPFTKWLPGWSPSPHMTPDVLAWIDAEEAEFLRIGEALGASAMTVIEPFGTRWPDDVLAECLGRIGRRGAEAGMQVNLEFIPFLGVPDLRSAWRAVDGCGVESVGLVIDSWHYFRGTPDDELLAAIPGQRIGAVQLSDAPRTPPEDLRQECLHARLPVGKGGLPLDRLLRVLGSTGGLHRMGPEIFSDDFDGRPALVNAQRARRGLDSWSTAAAASTASPEQPTRPTPTEEWSRTR